MDANQLKQKKESLKDSQAGEIIGPIIFTLVMGFLMCLSAKLFL